MYQYDQRISIFTEQLCLLDNKYLFMKGYVYYQETSK